jgi:uncharacterized membrane protein
MQMFGLWMVHLLFHHIVVEMEYEYERLFYHHIEMLFKKAKRKIELNFFVFRLLFTIILSIIEIDMLN